MKVTVFGTGYVGLVQGAVLASVGHEVICTDVDPLKITDLNSGKLPIFEPGLALLVKEHVQSGRLQFTSDAKTAISHGDFQFIAVGTPPDQQGSADLTFVLAVADSIATFMQSDKIIINKSTVPVGTADQVSATIAKKLLVRGSQWSFSVVSNPEFLKEGSAVSDCLKPDRIIIGSSDKKAQQKMRQLYAPFNRNHDKIIIMDARSAELTKYAANGMLATKISFMNEMANLAEELGADIEAVRHGIGSDPRIGYQFIYPGCGYGGSCFPKDLQALIASAKKTKANSSMLEAVEQVNYRQKHKLYQYLEQHFNGDFSNKIIALWGLSFKPNTDDMREAPSRVLMEKLWQKNVKIQAFDPEAMPTCQKIYATRDDLLLVETKEAALKNADALVICTEWSQFRAPNFKLIAEQLNEKLIIDGRNMYEPSALKEQGFAYYAIGRGLSVKELPAKELPVKEWS